MRPHAPFVSAFPIGWATVLDALTTVIALIAAVTLLWKTLSPRETAPRRSLTEKVVVSIANSPSRGSADAKVAVIEYSDFECSFCRKAFRELLPVIDSEYVSKGRVLWVFRHFPLQRLHPLAFGAAVAAECAAQQDRFWPLHDRLYDHDDRLDPASVREDVVATGADMIRWDDCIKSADAVSRIERDRSAGRTLNVTGTPTFLIGRVRPGRVVEVTEQINGMGTLDQWRATLAKALTSGD